MIFLVFSQSAAHFKDLINKLPCTLVKALASMMTSREDDDLYRLLASGRHSNFLPTSSPGPVNDRPYFLDPNLRGIVHEQHFIHLREILSSARDCMKQSVIMAATP